MSALAHAVAVAGLCMATGLVAGVFLAFSDFIMRGLDRADPAQAAAGMNGLNKTVLVSVFLTSFFLIGPVALALSALAPVDTPAPVRAALLGGGVVFLVSVVGVTITRNVPMNNRLARADAPEACWPDYRRFWTEWNHVRTLGATASFALFLLAAAVLI